MEVVSYFIYGASFWFREVAGGIECVWFVSEDYHERSEPLPSSKKNLTLSPLLRK